MYLTIYICNCFICSVQGGSFALVGPHLLNCVWKCGLTKLECLCLHVCSDRRLGLLHNSCVVVGGLVSVAEVNVVDVDCLSLRKVL